MQSNLSKYFGELADNAPEFVRGEARYLGETATREVAERTPVGVRIDNRTGLPLGPDGRLRRSWKAITPTKRGSTWTTGTSSDVSYALDVDAGTKAHVIPQGGSAAGIILHFWSKGHLEIFTRSVHHPGTRGHYMMERGLRATERDYSEQGPRRLQAFLDNPRST